MELTGGSCRSVGPRWSHLPGPSDTVCVRHWGQTVQGREDQLWVATATVTLYHTPDTHGSVV